MLDNNFTSKIKNYLTEVTKDWTQHRISKLEDRSTETTQTEKLIGEMGCKGSKTYGTISSRLMYLSKQSKWKREKEAEEIFIKDNKCKLMKNQKEQ